MPLLAESSSKKNYIIILFKLLFKMRIMFQEIILLELNILTEKI